MQPHKSYDLDVLKSLAAAKFAKFEELKNCSYAAVTSTICDVLGFVSTVLSLYAKSSNPFKNFMAELGYNTQDNKQVRITKAARRAWDAYLFGDRNYSLPAMMFLGAVMQHPWKTLIVKGLRKTISGWNKFAKVSSEYGYQCQLHIRRLKS